jgi:hypothetical protein
LNQQGNKEEIIALFSFSDNLYILNFQIRAIIFKSNFHLDRFNYVFNLKKL